MDENPYKSPQALSEQPPPLPHSRPKFVRVRTVFAGLALGIVASAVVGSDFYTRLVCGVYVAGYQPNPSNLSCTRRRNP